MGELVGIKDPKDASEMWQISVVRWMDLAKDVGLRVGLEVLSMHSLVIKVEEVKSRKISQRLPMEGILLPTVEGVREEAHLIFPSYIFKTEDQLKITIGSREEKVRLTNIDYMMGNFAYCNFEIIDLEGTAQGTIESFDDVWEFI